MLWENCDMTSFYYGLTANSISPCDVAPCDVRIDGGEIVVGYEGEKGPAVYKGKNQGDGHYVLESPELDGRATLHRAPDSLYLEGYWIEGGLKGMWRIALPDLGSYTTPLAAEPYYQIGE